MYGMLLESVQYYLIEKYGEPNWEEIRQCAGISDHVFVTHERYSEASMKKIADSAEYVLGERTDMTSDDFMEFFGSCFVKFLSHYGYDRVIRVSGRHLRDFVIGIDNLHEHMRFGYPKLQSPSFYCEGETRTGLTLHYISKRKGFMFYVVGQVKEIASSFYNIDLAIKILSHEIKNNTTHVVYRLGFDNSGYRPPAPDLLSIKQKCGIDVEVFFSVFPFSFVLSYNMVIEMAGYGLASTVGNRVIGNDVRETFTLRRPKAQFTWETVRPDIITRKWKVLEKENFRRTARGLLIEINTRHPLIQILTALAARAQFVCFCFVHSNEVYFFLSLTRRT